VTHAEAERLLEVIRIECDELIAGVSGDPRPAVQAQAVGMAALRDHLLGRLDFRMFASPDDADLRSRMTSFCQRHCPLRDCRLCPMRKITKQPTERQVAHIMEDFNGTGDQGSA
jgi:hypothetical protein